MRVVDLRSDTVTLPTREMRRAMYEAECGDDVWGEDPTVKRLEEKSAELMGKEAGLFTTSGTQSNLLSVLTWCRRGDEVIMGSESHMFWYEVGGASALGGAQMRTVPNDEYGRLNPRDVEAAIRPDNVHFPRTKLVCLENTHNRCGGAALSVKDMAAVAQVAHAKGIPVHLDGARIFNAAVYHRVPAKELTRDVDDVGFCLSKGLSCPIGSVLCGSKEFIKEAHRWRKMVGGGMRQVGIIAAAGLVALDKMIDRLAEDHEMAHRLAVGLAGIPGVQLNPEKVQTNLVLFVWTGGPVPEFLRLLAERGVKASHPGGQRIRMVPHCGITNEDIDYTIDAVAAVAKGARA